MTNETGFINKVLKMISGEVAQLEKMLTEAKPDEIQTAYIRGERARLLQMRNILNKRLNEVSN